VQNFAFKLQAVAEKTAKILGGYFILPHPVQSVSQSIACLSATVVHHIKTAKLET